MEDLVIEGDSLPKDLSANTAHKKKYGTNDSGSSSWAFNAA
jgi:hypothetical protein